MAMIQQFLLNNQLSQLNEAGNTKFNNQVRKNNPKKHLQCAFYVW